MYSIKVKKSLFVLIVLSATYAPEKLFAHEYQQCNVGGKAKECYLDSNFVLSIKGEKKIEFNIVKRKAYQKGGGGQDAVIELKDEKGAKWNFYCQWNSPYCNLDKANSSFNIEVPK